MSRLVLDHAERHDDQELTAWGLLLHGRSEACLGRLEAGAAALEKSVALLRETGDQLGTAVALNGLGIVQSERGLLSESLSSYAQAMNTARAISDHLMATILSNMCVTYTMLGQLEQAESAGSRSLAIAPDERVTTLQR